MALSSKFWQIISKVFPFADFLHILQLEDYQTSRYFKRLNYLFFRRNLQRLEKLVWTDRVKITLALSILLIGIGVFLVGPFYLTFITLTFYLAYNKNGPKFLWYTLLLSSFITNLLLQFSNYFEIFQQTILTIADYLSWLVLINAGILLIFTGIIGESSIPKQGKKAWFIAVGVILTILILPLNEPLVLLQILFLFASISVLFIPFWLGIANWFLSPVYFVMKRWLYFKAGQKIEQMKHLKTITVIGSYGKTTTKNFINQFLKFNYRVQMVPGNINTSTGIANWILHNLQTYADILLVEADGYDGAEYTNSGQILQPDLVILTTVGDQHLERFRSRKNLANSMLKLCQKTKPKGTIIFSSMTKEDLDCWEIKYQNLLSTQNLIYLDTATNLTYLDQKLPSNNLSATNQINLHFALKVAERFNISKTFVFDSFKNLELPDRRQREIKQFGFQTLDDSYNISFTTAKAGLDQATKRAKELNKKLVVIFAGIPELGKENTLANTEFAEILAKRAQFVILLETILISDITTIFDKNQFDKFVMAGSMAEAWEMVQKKFNPKTHYILMQPELNDLYYEI